MPLCCNVIRQDFTNEVITTVPYTGDEPTVKVYYAQGGGYVEAGMFTQVVLTPTSVVVTHGGPATGFVKLIQ